ncbi:hypothetical protein LINGRAHAP2_LOCUS14061 [Linum grandiflorum]
MVMEVWARENGMVESIDQSKVWATKWI